MHKTVAITIIALAALIGASSAFAAPPPYYVVQNAKKTCLVTRFKPDGKSTTMVGVVTYTTKAKARAAIRAAAACPHKP